MKNQKEELKNRIRKMTIMVDEQYKKTQAEPMSIKDDYTLVRYLNRLEGMIEELESI